ncbi:MAG: hypothetical protein Q4G49_13495 [Paracoccus sp. (in: a-proteobacteria)]|nr:hypothetical protein [Paracoccus sp. (in: a-proteobacteria)]
MMVGIGQRDRQACAAQHLETAFRRPFLGGAEKPGLFRVERQPGFEFPRSAFFCPIWLMTLAQSVSKWAKNARTFSRVHSTGFLTVLHGLRGIIPIPAPQRRKRQTAGSFPA